MHVYWKRQRRRVVVTRRQKQKAKHTNKKCIPSLVVGLQLQNSFTDHWYNIGTCRSATVIPIRPSDWEVRVCLRTNISGQHGACKYTAVESLTSNTPYTNTGVTSGCSAFWAFRASVCCAGRQCRNEIHKVELILYSCTVLLAWRCFLVIM